MLQRIIFALLSCFCLQLAFAETCPTVSEIKHSKLIGWKAYDSDDHQSLSANQQKHFKHAVSEFVLAEWSKSDKLGAIHCYYRDKSGSNLDAYLAKEHFHPRKIAQHFWYPVSGHLHCAASFKQCEFESVSVKKQQLAQK